MGCCRAYRLDVGHVLWNIAATIAIDEVRDEYGIDAELVDAD